jgi:hypothetical protein
VPVVEPLYESYRWSAAVAPPTGDAVWWELPRLAAAGGALCLDRWAPHDAESRQSVLRDQAPAHGAQRVAAPEHGLRRWVPAASPALHPVERLWEDLKGRRDVLAPWVRSSLGALQEHVAGIVQRDTAESIASRTGSAYWVDAAYALSV